MALANFFTGRVAQREYSQEFDFEYIPNYTVVTRDGVEVQRYISSYTRNFVTAKVVEQTFRFTGHHHERLGDGQRRSELDCADEDCHR